MGREGWKRGKIERLVLLLTGALNARDKVGLKMNIEESQLQALLKALPALRNPTIAHLATRRLGGGRDDHRRKDRARDHPPTERTGRGGDHRIPAEQSGVLKAGEGNTDFSHCFRRETVFLSTPPPDQTEV